MILFYKTVSRFDAKRRAGSRQLAGGDHTIEEDVGRDPYDEIVEFAGTCIQTGWGAANEVFSVCRSQGVGILISVGACTIRVLDGLLECPTQIAILPSRQYYEWNRVYIRQIDQVTGRITSLDGNVAR